MLANGLVDYYEVLGVSSKFTVQVVICYALCFTFLCFQITQQFLLCQMAVAQSPASSWCRHCSRAAEQPAGIPSGAATPQAYGMRYSLLLALMRGWWLLTQLQ
jgi:hypothetical protein